MFNYFFFVWVHLCEMVNQAELNDSSEYVGEGDEDKVVEGGGVGHLG